MGVEAFWLERLFEPRQVELHHPVAQFSGGRHIEVPVGVDHQFDVRANRIAKGTHEVFCVCRPGCRDLAIDIPAVVPAHFRAERVELERLVTECHLALRIGHAGVDIVYRADVGVDGDRLAHLAAEQVPDGTTECLAFDVPERHVDPAGERGAETA